MSDATGGGQTQLDELARLDRAVAEFNVRDTLEALSTSGLLDGLYRQITAGWRSIRNAADYHDIIARAVDALVAALQNREQIRDVAGFLCVAANRRAADENRRRQREVASDPGKMSGRVIAALPFDPKEGIALARSLLPRMRNETAAAVIGLYLDALEAGREYVPHSEVAETLGITEESARQLRRRGFATLARLAKEERRANPDFRLPEIWSDDEDDLRVEPDSNDRDD